MKVYEITIEEIDRKTEDVLYADHLYVAYSHPDLIAKALINQFKKSDPESKNKKYAWRIDEYEAPRARRDRRRGPRPRK